MAIHRSVRRTSHVRSARSSRRGVAIAAAVGAVAALTAVPADAAPDDPSSSDVSTRIDRLYTDAERSTERYNAVSERVTHLRERVEKVQDQAARKQAVVNRLRDELAELAGAQYRSGGIDPAVMLLLSSDPDTFLAKAATLDRIGARNVVRLRRLLEAQRVLEQYRAQAARTLTELASRRTQLERHKRSVQRRLRTAQRLLNGLSTQERAARDRVSRGAGRPPAVTRAGTAPSSRAATAVAAARSAVGAPYRWGQAGPRAFDCSGLTQWAYARAGVAIPRTSQAQAGVGRRVSLGQARPGDLVVYRDDASHVGMYVGGGQVVHAPYPGARVRFEPVGMMPVHAVTRPAG